VMPNAHHGHVWSIALWACQTMLVTPMNTNVDPRYRNGLILRITPASVPASPVWVSTINGRRALQGARRAL